MAGLFYGLSRRIAASVTASLTAEKLKKRVVAPGVNGT